MSDDKIASSSQPPLRVDPDVAFVETITEWGGGDLKTCFQCATCSVVCPLSPDVNPFPRKEMIWAQWGLKDKLANDPDLWLCHRCNDCSENCPRGAKTGDVMAALRSYAYQAHAFPRFLGRWVNRPLMLPVLLAVPALVIWAVISLGGHFGAPLGEDASLSSRYWGNMIEPWPWLDLGFIAVAAFAVLSLTVGVRSAWRGFMKSGVQPDVTPRVTVVEAVKRALVDILLHRKFKECGAAAARRGAHLLILYGFGGLFLTTALVFIGMYLFGLQTPLPLGHPIKILGNASAIAISIGLILVIARRTSSTDEVTWGRNAYQDVLFLGVITLVVLTGILSEVFRLATFHDGAAGAYYMHLVFIFFLIFYAPFSKFAHVVYHTTALAWAHHVGRELKTLPVKAASPAEKAA
jgi:quinone-modifying oxidoreductase subunit QmoC